MLPLTVPAKDIYITLGSPWVPADIIDDFIIHLFGDPCEHLYGCYDADQIRETWKTIHDEITGTWELVRELSGSEYRPVSNHEWIRKRKISIENSKLLLDISQKLRYN